MPGWKQHLLTLVVASSSCKVSLRASPVVLSMWWCCCTVKLDEEKSKTCGRVWLKNVVLALSAWSRFAVIAERRSNGVPPIEKSVINMIWLLLSISDWPIVKIGPSGLQLAVSASHLFGVPTVCTCRKECNKYDLTAAQYVWLAHRNDWSRWFAISSLCLTPIWCPSQFHLYGWGCKKVNN